MCPTRCNHMDCSLPGSSVYGISQARMLEWVAVSFSRGSSLPRDRTHVSCVSYIGRQTPDHCATHISYYFTDSQRKEKQLSPSRQFPYDSHLNPSWSQETLQDKWNVITDTCYWKVHGDSYKTGPRNTKVKTRGWCGLKLIQTGAKSWSWLSASSTSDLAGRQLTTTPGEERMVPGEGKDEPALPPGQNRWSQESFPLSPGFIKSSC